MRKKFSLNGKALSPIFATLIILAIVTVLFIPVFIWASGMTAQTQDSWSQSAQTSTERIVIEEVSFTDTQIIVYVRNIGKTAVSINDVLIEDSDEVVKTYQVSLGELATVDPETEAAVENSIVQGSLIALKITDFKGLNLDSIVYTIRVFTDRGVGETYQLAA